MKYINSFDVPGLKSLGIEFTDENKSKAFAEIILEEYEVRVGRGISEGLTDAELDEFVHLTGADCPQEELEEWITLHCPDLGGIIERVNRELKTELLMNINGISGTSRTAETRVNAALIDVLLLSVNCHDAVISCGIDTVGELRTQLAAAGASAFSAAELEEINAKLKDFMEFMGV